MCILGPKVREKEKLRKLKRIHIFQLGDWAVLVRVGYAEKVMAQF